MARVSFSEMLVGRAPGKAAKKLAYHRQRIAVLQAGGTPRQYETLDEHRKVADRYERAFRETGRCEDCGHVLTDPASIRRGIGPDCWAKRNVNRRGRTDAEMAELLERAKTFDPEVGF